MLYTAFYVNSVLIFNTVLLLLLVVVMIMMMMVVLMMVVLMMKIQYTIIQSLCNICVSVF